MFGHKENALFSARLTKFREYILLVTITAASLSNEILHPYYASINAITLKLWSLVSMEKTEGVSRQKFKNVYHHIEQIPNSIGIQDFV